jgi:Zn-dependent peptidase ImmA (M78 family)/transcriptional regulator with XRE-family HTH domain
MLVLARESRGLTQAELAHRIESTQSKVSKLEDGLMDLSQETAQKLSSALRYPEHFFYQTGSVNSISPTFYRRYLTLPKLILRQSIARMNIVKRQIRHLLSGAEPLETKIPHCDPEEFPGGVPAIAKHIRQLWGMAPGPVRNLTQLIESAGCIVIHFDFGTRKIDGCSDVVDGTPVIFLNQHMAASRMRFTLAHELAHIVMHIIAAEENEQQANCFAGEFLMPENDIKSSLLPISIDRLARLKLYWRVSMQALLHRAQDLGVIRERTVRYYWMLMSKLGYRENEPHEKEIPRETPSLLKSLIEMHLQDLGYTVGELAFDLASTEEDFSEWCQLQPVMRLVA